MCVVPIRLIAGCAEASEVQYMSTSWAQVVASDICMAHCRCRMQNCMSTSKSPGVEPNQYEAGLQRLAMYVQ